MIEIRPYDSSLAELWNRFVADSKQGTFLLDRNYMDYHRDRFTDHSLMVYNDGKLYALLPANIDGSTLWSHQGLTYGGLITQSNASASGVCESFRAINQYLKAEGIVKVVYKAIPWIYHCIPAEEDLYALFKECNATLVVRNIASTIVLQNPLKWRRDRHYGANKAHTAGITVSQDDKAYPEFWKVLTDNLMTRHNAKPVHTLDEIQRLHTAFPDNIKLYVARLNGEVVGGSLLYLSPQVIHSQYISATPEGKHLHAVDAIFRQILANDCEGAKYFDFGTSNEDGGRFLNEGLISQKEGFGGRGVCYDTYEWNL